MKTGLQSFFLNRGFIIWNHVKNLFQLKNNTLQHRANSKTRFKTENNFIIYETVHCNTSAICSYLVMSQFLSTSEGRKKGAWMCHPTWKLDFKRPFIRVDYILPPQSPKTALRIVESVPPAKMLKKYLNYLNASVIWTNLKKILK